MTSRKPEWKTNPDLPVGKGATLQQWIATVGESKFEMDVAPWGEGHLKVNGRQIGESQGRQRQEAGFSRAQQDGGALHGESAADA